MTTRTIPVNQNGRAITTTVETITPDDATAYLERNRLNNRHVNDRRITDYAREMKAGQWRLNGEPIIFDWDDELLNGQHRLYAIIEANIPVRIVVVRGVDPATFYTMDQGKVRSGRDVLQGEGRGHPDTLSSVLRIEHSHRSGNILGGGPARLRPSQLPAILSDMPGAEEAAAFAGQNMKRLFGVLTPGEIGWLYLHTNAIDPRLAATFFDHLATGAGMGTDHPLLALRNRLVVMEHSKHVEDRKERLAIAVKAWNAFVTGSGLRVLRYMHGEAFPKFARPAAGVRR